MRILVLGVQLVVILAVLMFVGVVAEFWCDHGLFGCALSVVAEFCAFIQSNPSMALSISLGVFVVSVLLHCGLAMLGLSRSGRKYLSDAPLNPRKGVDILKRTPYIARIKDMIERAPQDGNAQYIGIYGPWGAGKTSDRMLLENAFGSVVWYRRPIFVDYNPWAFSEAVDLPSSLFSAIASACSGRWPFVGGLIVSAIGSSLRMRQISMCMTSAHWVIDVVKSLGLVMFPLDVIKKLAQIVLRLSSRRIVVVVDDLDRLPSAEIARMIRLLKSNGDLPNVTYLILADEEYLAAAIGEFVPRVTDNILENGRKYLKKIITFPCSVPFAIDGATLKSYFVQELEPIFQANNINDEITRMNLTVASSFFRTIRHVKELLNAVAGELEMQEQKVGKGQAPCVKGEDLVAITAIKLFEPKFYARIYDFYRRALACYRGGKKRISEEELDKELLSFWSSREDLRVAKIFIREHLGFVSDLLNQGQPQTWYLRRPDDPKLLMSMALASEYCITNYFCAEMPTTILPVAYLQEFKCAYYSNDLGKCVSVAVKADADKCLPQLLICLKSLLDLRNNRECKLVYRIIGLLLCKRLSVFGISRLDVVGCETSLTILEDLLFYILKADGEKFGLNPHEVCIDNGSCLPAVGMIMRHECEERTLVDHGNDKYLDDEHFLSLASEYCRIVESDELSSFRDSLMLPNLVRIWGIAAWFLPNGCGKISRYEVLTPRLGPDIHVIFLVRKGCRDYVETFKNMLASIDRARESARIRLSVVSMKNDEPYAEECKRLASERWPSWPVSYSNIEDDDVFCSFEHSLSSAVDEWVVPVFAGSYPMPHWFDGVVHIALRAKGPIARYECGQICDNHVFVQGESVDNARLVVSLAMELKYEALAQYFGAVMFKKSLLEEVLSGRTRGLIEAIEDYSRTNPKCCTRTVLTIRPVKFFAE